MRRIYYFLSLLILGAGILLGLGGLAAAAPGYCVGDSVVPGGVSGASAVAAAYKHPRVSHVYKYFGITKQDVSGLGKTAVTGTVTKTGKVIVKGKTVATHAISAGCGFIAGSTKVNDGYMTFYTRPTSVSFAQPSLSAMVVMKNKTFAFAVLNSCGNPIKATALKPPVKKVVQTKKKVVIRTQTQTQTQTVVINSPPQVKAVQTTQPASPAAIPNTGPGDVAGVFGVATIAGSAGHYLYRRRRA